MDQHTMQNRDSVPPEDLESEVATYIQRAANARIDAEVVRSYAKLLIASTRSVQQAECLRKSQEDFVAWLASNDLVSSLATTDWESARRQIGKSRSASQQIEMSANAAVQRTERFLEVLQARVELLPCEAPADGGKGFTAYERQMAQIRQSVFLLKDYVRAMKSWREKNLLEEHQQFREIDPARSISDLTFFWWFHHGPKKPGRLKHMCDLGYFWNLTKIQDSRDFKRYMRERRLKVKWSFDPPKWSLAESQPPALGLARA